MLKATRLLLLFIAAHYACFSQGLPKGKVGRLLVQFRTPGRDTNQLNILHQLDSYYLERHFRINKPDLDSAFISFSREKNLSTMLHRDAGSGRLESLCSLGNVYILQRICSTVVRRTSCI